MQSFKYLFEIFKISWLATIRFNLKYLPFSQAKCLPVLLYNTKIISLQGIVKIECEHIKPGMIILGREIVSVYSSKHGFRWENRGTVIFRGQAVFGAGSAVSVAKDAIFEIGNNALFTSTARIAVYERISLGENFRGAWEIVMIDTDFHEVLNIESLEIQPMTKPIIIGDSNWFGIRTLVLKGTQTPNFCISGSCSLLNKSYDIPSYSLIAGNPAKLRKTCVARAEFYKQ